MNARLAPLKAMLPLAALLAFACAPPNTAAPVTAQAAAPLSADQDHLQAALDQSALINATNALDDAVDRKDWRAARALFADQVEVDFASIGGPATRVSADSLVQGWESDLPLGKESFHMRGGHVTRLEGDVGAVSSKAYAYNRLPGRPAGQDLWEVWGAYEHRFARTPDGWRITAMSFKKTLERGDPNVRTALPETPRGPADARASAYR